MIQAALDLHWSAPGGDPDLLDTPLHAVTFCVVDLETTGGAPERDGITEVGAVTVRGGEVLGEFATLVDPGTAVPAPVVALTGITNRLLAGAPTLDGVLPAFLEFSAGAVLVAHNAAFDVAFLRRACAERDRAWPDPPVVDTVRLARAVVDQDEAPDHRLATLARLFRAATQPCHRALDDARATVDVLHGLIARMPAAHTVRDLLCVGPAPPRRAGKRRLATGVPSGPGVYQFVDARGRVLYVGSATDLRSRVLTYFTHAERRRRITEMVALADDIVPVPCPTVLEARIRELRLIAGLRPPYNRRSRSPDRLTWLVLTREPAPRAALVREPAGRDVLAVFPGRATATDALAALHAVSDLRHCTDRLPEAGGRSACVQGQIGRCAAPCESGAPAYADEVHRVRSAATEDPQALLAPGLRRLAALAAEDRFEAAAALRDGLDALSRGIDRAHRLSALHRLGTTVAAAPFGDRPRGWEVVCVRGGRLAGSARSAPGRHPGPTAEALAATADLEAASPLLEEADLVWRWLAREEVRLLRVEGSWWLPTRSGRAVMAR